MAQQQPAPQMLPQENPRQHSFNKCLSTGLDAEHITTVKANQLLTMGPLPVGIREAASRKGAWTRERTGSTQDSRGPAQSMQSPQAQRVPGAAVRSEGEHTVVALLMLSASWPCGRSRQEEVGPSGLRIPGWQTSPSPWHPDIPCDPFPTQRPKCAFSNRNHTVPSLTSFLSMARTFHGGGL